MRYLHRSVSYQQFLSHILFKQPKLHVNKINKLTTSVLSNSKSSQQSQIQFWSQNHRQKQAMSTLAKDEKTDVASATTQPYNVR